jgi:hypothetical protein
MERLGSHFVEAAYLVEGGAALDAELIIGIPALRQGRGR